MKVRFHYTGALEIHNTRYIQLIVLINKTVQTVSVLPGAAPMALG